MPQMKIRGNTQIIDGTILNAQIGASAAIATSKLADGAEFVQRDGSVAFSGDVDLGGFKVTNLATGTNPNDAVTYQQLQDLAAGVSSKEAVRLATTAGDGNLSLTGAVATIDGVAPVNGDRILVKNQTDPITNGVYVYNNAGAWSRAADFDDVPDSEVQAGDLVFVTEGSSQGGSSWILIGSGNLVVDTDPLNFTQFSGSGSTTGASVGSGAAVFQGLNGNTLEFRSILSTTEIASAISGSGDEIELSLQTASVTGAKIAANTITAGNIASETITSAELAASSVTSSELAADAVITSKILDNAVTEPKLAALSVSTAKLQDNSVTAAKLADNSVDTLALQDNSVTLIKMADNSVSTDEIVNLSVTLAKLAANSVDASKIVDGSVGNAELAALAVATGNIQDDAVTSAKIAAGAVTNTELALLSVATGNIQDDAVTAAKLATDSVTSDAIAENAVGSSEIAAGAVTGSELASDAVTDIKVAVGAAIQRTKLASGGANHVVVNDGTGVMSSEAQLSLSRGGTNADLSSASSHAILHIDATGSFVDSRLLTGSRALVSDSNGVPEASAVTSTELGYLSGVTSSIQTQLDARVSEANFVFNETPASIGGNAYQLSATPITGKLQVMLNGLVLRPGSGNDYTIATDTITMEYALSAGDYLSATYIHD